MELFRTFILCPAAVQLAGDDRQNLNCRLPFMRSEKDCRGADCIQDLTRRDEIVLHCTSAIWNAHCCCRVL